MYTTDEKRNIDRKDVQSLPSYFLRITILKVQKFILRHILITLYVKKLLRMKPEISKIADAPDPKFGTRLLKATTFIKPIICA